MFGRMRAVAIIDLKHAPDEVGGCATGAVARLLDVTEQPRIEKWVQFPKAVFVFLLVPGDPESGAFYVYDRRARVWYWVDFEDDKFGGYSVRDFDRLVRECRFLGPRRASCVADKPDALDRSAGSLVTARWCGHQRISFRINKPGISSKLI